ncbi:MAG: phosphate acyltransferase PlsX [Clostridia bacterium]|nr:phosphate acyltransferase PlsX [Clostridia bacterium]MBR4799395.1 phosphate acyltransferase PlsX [Clostridia bacterium]MBR5746636.1 phosphate acyltransferase PlsX [Clostridia bacterium]
MSIRIAVDIMGGDNPPESLAAGALKAAAETGAEIVLVGTEAVKQTLGALPEGVSFVTAASVVEMTDEPSSVTKEKKDSSLAEAVNLCRDGKADAVVSSGNTGALFTAASLTLRRIKGVRRAALATVVPLEKPFILLDCGANTDATPDIIALYARMGAIYAENVLGIKEPRVGLVNNGAEPHKGTPLYREAFALLQSDENINFIGNCEGKSIPFGCCDVLVCDGFTGNIVLKTIEGMAHFLFSTLKNMFAGNPASLAAGALTRGQTKKLKHRLDPAEYGGAPFLGLAKPVIKAHGGSDEYAFCSAIKQAAAYAQSGTIEKIAGAMAKKAAEEE